MKHHLAMGFKVTCTYISQILGKHRIPDTVSGFFPLRRFTPWIICPLALSPLADFSPHLGRFTPWLICLLAFSPPG